jgi:hypothetical protein
MAFARNKAVPMFESKLRAAAHNAGVRYLDASRLFHGHEVCTDNTSVRGLFIEVGIWNENAARQSFHPNYRGHGMFAGCMTAFYGSGLPTATCVDPASIGTGTLIPGLLEFRQLRNAATGKCADASGHNSRIRTVMQNYTCNGGRNQGFWYDPARQSRHLELSHDRCLDVKGGSVVPRVRQPDPVHAAAAAGDLLDEQPPAVVVRDPQLRQPGRLRARRLHRLPGLLSHGPGLGEPPNACSPR